MTVSIWFNHDSANLQGLRAQLRAGVAAFGLGRKAQDLPDPGPDALNPRKPFARSSKFKIIVSDLDLSSEELPDVDEFFTDMILPCDDYAAWCLERCLVMKANVLWPAMGARAVSSRKADFENLGITPMVCASPIALDVLNNKEGFYRSLKGSGVKLPNYVVVHTTADLNRIMTGLSLDDPALHMAFRQSVMSMDLNPPMDKAKGSKAAALDRSSVPDPSGIMARSQEKGRLPTPVLFLEIPRSPQYSVNCLAMDGRLLCATIRQKPFYSDEPGIVVENDEILAMASKLSKLFHLSYLFNINVFGSPPAVFNIEPRLSSGFYFPPNHGPLDINYPYLALRLALGCDPEPDPSLPIHAFDCESPVPQLNLAQPSNPDLLTITVSC